MHILYFFLHGYQMKSWRIIYCRWVVKKTRKKTNNAIKILMTHFNARLDSSPVYSVINLVSMIPTLWYKVSICDTNFMIWKLVSMIPTPYCIFFRYTIQFRLYNSDHIFFWSWYLWYQLYHIYLVSMIPTLWYKVGIYEQHTNLSHSRMEKLTSAVRETSVYRHNGEPN